MNDYKWIDPEWQRYFTPTLIKSIIKGTEAERVFGFEQECEKSYNAGNGLLWMCFHWNILGFWRRSDSRLCFHCDKPLIDLVKEQKEIRKRYKKARLKGETDVYFYDQCDEEIRYIYEKYSEHILKNFNYWSHNDCGLPIHNIINLEIPRCQCTYQQN